MGAKQAAFFVLECCIQSGEKLDCNKNITLVNIMNPMK